MKKSRQDKNIGRRQKPSNNIAVKFNIAWLKPKYQQVFYVILMMKDSAKALEKLPSRRTKAEKILIKDLESGMSLEEMASQLVDAS